MAFGTKKIELSPRLRSGVGRGYSQNQILKLAAVICLCLAAVLAFNAVRLMVNGKTSGDNAGQGQVLGASDSQPSAAQNQIQFVSYTVQSGDTLFDISQKFNISWNTLATINNLKSPFYLKPGQVLQVPKQ